MKYIIYRWTPRELPVTFRLPSGVPKNKKWTSGKLPVFFRFSSGARVINNRTEMDFR